MYVCILYVYTYLQSGIVVSAIVIILAVIFRITIISTLIILLLVIFTVLNPVFCCSQQS